MAYIPYNKGGKLMPTISTFYGIVIMMYQIHKEHNPPHIHAIYGDDVAAIDFQTDRVIEGNYLLKY